MYEDHVEDRNIAHQVLHPELIIAVSSRAGVCNHCGGDQCEECAGECPEIADVEKGLGFPDDHVAGEDDHPAADGDGQMLQNVAVQLGQNCQSPEIGQLRDDHHKGQHIAEIGLPLHVPDVIPEAINEENDADSNENRQKMGEGEVLKLYGVTYSKEITTKFKHREPPVS